jgi:uncharacterized protein YaaQ
MKLMLIIVRDEDADPATQELIQNDYRVTRMASTGGFLRRGNSTLLVGVEDDRIEAVTALLQRICRPADSDQRRATIFVLNMTYHTKI